MGRKGPSSIDEDDALIFRKAVPSQYKSVLYEQLKKEKRLDRFKQALQMCGLRNLSLTESCEYLSKLFPGYVRGKGLNRKTLGEMIGFYPDLSDAYGFSYDIGAMATYNRAKLLAETTDVISDIDLFNRMYDKGDLLYIRESKNGASESGNLDSADTVKTINKLLAELSTVEEPEDEDIEEEGVTDEESSDSCKS